MAAIISATALLAGYMYQKHEERVAEIRKTQQEIYSRLVTNITDRSTIFDHFEKSSAWQSANYEKKYSMFAEDAKGVKNLVEMKEISTFLSLYGTDDAIRAYVSFIEEGLNNENRGVADLGKLIVGLRKSIYPETKITANEANLIIWKDEEYLNKPPATK